MSENLICPICGHDVFNCGPDEGHTHHAECDRCKTDFIRNGNFLITRGENSRVFDAYPKQPGLFKIIRNWLK